jgi:CubicO group peptidase (beta-lactamase class C family)
MMGAGFADGMGDRIRPLAWIAAAAAAALIVGAACGSEPTGAEESPSPAVSPAASGLDPVLLGAALDQAGALPQLRSLIVARDGRVIAERVFRGPGLDTPVNIKSASKAVISALVGIAIAKGELTGPDQRIAPVLGRRVPASADPRVQTLTVGNLLSMQAGLERTSGRNYGRWVTSRDWVGYALAQPFVDQPGGGMLYSTGSTHILSAVLTDAAGRPTLQLAREWLAGPLGLNLPPWPRDPQGVYFGGNDMLMSPRALLRFGEMYRNGGVHQGRQVVPAEWVRQSWTVRTRSPRNGNGYGYGWWIKEVGGHPVYFAWGHGGQMVYVAPSLAMTVVMTSDPNARSVDGHLQALHGIFDRLLVPAAERGGLAADGAASS